MLDEWSLCSWHITVLVKTSSFFEPSLLFVTNGTVRITWLCLIAWSWSLCFEKKKKWCSFLFGWLKLRDGEPFASKPWYEPQCKIFGTIFIFVHFCEIYIDLNYYWWFFDYCFLLRKFYSTFHNQLTWKSLKVIPITMHI